MKTNLKNQKGITLVALVVTIIVLLILAGVSLSLVAGGNGIITKASTSAKKTNEGTAREQTELKLAELVADYYEDRYVNENTATADKTQAEYIAGRASTGVPAGDYTLKVTAATTPTADNAATFELKKTSNDAIVATGIITEEGKISTAANGWEYKVEN